MNPNYQNNWRKGGMSTILEIEYQLIWLFSGHCINCFDNLKIKYYFLKIGYNKYNFAMSRDVNIIYPPICFKRKWEKYEKWGRKWELFTVPLDRKWKKNEERKHVGSEVFSQGPQFRKKLTVVEWWKLKDFFASEMLLLT